MLVMENINMTHVFKHPKFYRIPRDKKDQAISDTSSTEASERASDPGLKPQATRTQLETNCSFDKNPNPQASGGKLQAPSCKHQAPSRKRQAP